MFDFIMISFLCLVTAALTSIFFDLIVGWSPRFLWQSDFHRQACLMVGDLAKEDLWEPHAYSTNTLVHKDSGVSVSEDQTFDMLPTYKVSGKGASTFKIRPGDVGYWSTHKMVKHSKKRKSDAKDADALASINAAYKSMKQEAPNPHHSHKP